jgi:hypothetical protein
LLSGPDSPGGAYEVQVQHGGGPADITGSRLDPGDAPALQAVAAARAVVPVDMTRFPQAPLDAGAPWGPAFGVRLRGTDAQPAVVIAAPRRGP